MKHCIFAATVTTIFLVIYCIFSRLAATGDYAFYMFLFSPVPVIWTVIAVLRDRDYKASELGDREFGYQDREV